MTGSSALDSYFNFNRRIAQGLTPFLLKTPLRPNHVTTLALLSGIMAACWMSQGSRLSMMAGAFFLQLSFILDNCDGEIARRKSLKSEFGMWYDFTADLAVDLALWTGLAFGSIGHAGAGVLIAVTLLAWTASIVNFSRVVWKRVRKKIETERPYTATNPLSSAMYVLGDDGDPSILVWIFAGIGDPFLFLVAGCLYINFLCVYSLIRHGFR